MTVGYYGQASVAELVNILCLLQASCADAIDSVQQTIVHNAFQLFLRAVFGHFDDYGLVIVVRKTYIEKGIYNVFQFIRVPNIYGKEVTEVIGKADFEEQMEVVEQTLRDINANNKPIYVVFNKIDSYTYEEYDEFSLEPKKKTNRTLDELKNSWIAKEKTPCIFISAKEKIGIDKLRSDIYKMVAEIHAGRYPFDNFLW